MQDDSRPPHQNGPARMKADPMSLAELARDLVMLDSRSSVSNLSVANRLETALDGFDIERLDYADASGVAKRALVAHRGGAGGIALSGHMDTVPDTGWQDDHWSGPSRLRSIRGDTQCSPRPRRP